MAYSQFLLQRAYTHGIDIGNSREEGKLLVCRCVLEGLEMWLRNPKYQKIFPARSFLENELFLVRAEVYNMDRLGELNLFWRARLIRSVGGVKNHIHNAYLQASAASSVQDTENDFILAATHIDACHKAIEKTIGEILIRRR